MAIFIRSAILVAFAFAVLIVQSALAAVVSLHPFTPNLLLPIVIFLGVQQDVYVVRGAAVSFLVGYALDAFCGSPIGLATFVMVATFMVARGAGIRLFLRGPLFQIALVLVASVLAGGTLLALGAIFSPPEAFRLEMPATGLAGELVRLIDDDEPRIGNVVGHAILVVGSSLTTALCAPVVFAGVRRIESLRWRRGSERDGAPTS